MTNFDAPARRSGRSLVFRMMLQSMIGPDGLPIKDVLVFTAGSFVRWKADTGEVVSVSQ